MLHSIVGTTSGTSKTEWQNNSAWTNSKERTRRKLGTALSDPVRRQQTSKPRRETRMKVGRERAHAGEEQVSYGCEDEYVVARRGSRDVPCYRLLRQQDS